MKYILTSSALSLLLAASVHADKQAGWLRGHGTLGTTAQQESGNSQSITISGKIDGFRHLNRQDSSGTAEQQTLVRLRLQDGRAMAVDLGPKRNLQKYDLEKGDQIQLTGNYANDAGRQVFKANRLVVNGNTYAIQRSGERQDSTRMARNSGQRQQMTFTGNIQGFRHIDVRGSQGTQQTHTLAKIKLENGKTAIVDLGPKQGLDKLKLEKGEQVRLQASQGKLDGKKVLLVDRLALIGRQEQQQARQNVGGTSSGSGVSGQKVTIQGTVRGYQITSIGTGDQQQVLLNLQLQDGRSVLIDAGKYQPGELNLKDLDLNDKVTITAHRSTSGNRQTLVADQIQFEEAQGGTSGSKGQGSSGKQSGGSQSQPKSNRNPNQ